jgi:uncharacterized protein (DUF1330 family)
MAAYVIAELEIHDAAGLEEYRRKVPATIEKYGGRFLVRGGAISSLEGGWAPKRLVVLEFPSREQLTRWYDSEDYRELKAMRMKAARTSLVAVDGV